MFYSENKFLRRTSGAMLILASICFFISVLKIDSDLQLSWFMDRIFLFGRNLDEVSKELADIGRDNSYPSEIYDSETILLDNTGTAQTLDNNSKRDEYFVGLLHKLFGVLTLHAIYISLFLWGISLLARPRGFSWVTKGVGFFIFSMGLMMIEGSILYMKNQFVGDKSYVAVGFWNELVINYVGEYVGLIAGFFIAAAGFFLAFDWLAVVFLYKVGAVVKFATKLLVICGGKIIGGIVGLFKFMLIGEEKEEGRGFFATPGEQLEIEFNSLPVCSETSKCGEMPVDISNSQVEASNMNSSGNFSVLPDLPEVEESGLKLNNSKKPGVLETKDNLLGSDEADSSGLVGSSVQNCLDRVNLVEDDVRDSYACRNERVSTGYSFMGSNEIGPTKTLAVKNEPSIVSNEHRVYTPPPIEIFTVPPTFSKKGYSPKDLERMAQHLETTLERFGAKAKVDTISQGPSVTRFELIPDPNVRVNKFQTLADDITLALKVDRVRVEAPIPGRGKVGVEVPNKEREIVWIRELLEDAELKNSKGKLKVPLGKDVAGKVRVVDITPMPHLLIAGATGSGKTVFMKQLLVSLLYQYTPEDLRVILIDPKLVEFSVFDGIPHLLMPVISDVKKAVECLSLLVKEMERRYEFLAQKGMNNIELYNRCVEKGEGDLFWSVGKDVHDRTDGNHYLGKIPYIVCIIDELADLILLQKNLVETLIIRLSQLARAVGIHLIVATQRPSVDVLRGLIKANFPVRISFRVSSKADSQCILDSIGGEKLIGNGDMLYYDGQKPVRIQGAYVSEKEVFALVDFLKKQGPPQYITNTGDDYILDEYSKEEYTGDDDPLYEEAVRTVLKEKQASVSLLQRKLRVGYARAGHLIDLMERRGLVGPHCGSKPREILLSPNEIQRILGSEMEYTGDTDEEEGSSEPPFEPMQTRQYL